MAEPQTAQTKELNAAQADHMRLLLEKLTEAQNRANQFLSQYAQEHGAQANGWQFDQANMRFVQVPGLPPGTNGNGNGEGD